MAEAEAALGARLAESYGRLPLSFEANEGQTDPQVDFIARGNGYTLFLTDGEAVLALRKPSTPGEDLKGTEFLARWDEPRIIDAREQSVLRMKLVGANHSPSVVGLDELPGKSNYFIGNDPVKWRTNVVNHAKLKYYDVYPGIDLVYYGNRGHLEYDFIVASGIDPGSIRLAFDGEDEISLDDYGNLSLSVDGVELVLKRPEIYQELNGARQAVRGGFYLDGREEVGIWVGTHDPDTPLVIDPVLEYSTYLGGTQLDSAQGIAVDASGNAYVTGHTYVSSFPFTSEAFQTSTAGDYDVFVTKFTATGGDLVYSTYFGGRSFDSGAAISVDESGHAYVTGLTGSSNLPLANPLQATKHFSDSAFIVKIDSSGSKLVYSTYLGGNGDDYGTDIALDALANVYVTGHTRSDNFPTAGGCPYRPIGVDPRTLSYRK